MNKESIIEKLSQALNIFEKSKVLIKFENDDVVRIEIISDVFKNVIITKRIDMVSSAILDISITDLRENNISIIALTEDEANIGLNENGNLRILVSKEDFEGIEVEIANPSEPNEYLKASAKRFKEKN